MSIRTAVYSRLGNSLSISHYGLFRLAPATLVLALCGGASFSQQPATPTGAASVAAAYGKLPLTFEPNQGQNDPRVRFSSRGQGYSLFLTDTAAVLSLSKPEPQSQNKVGRSSERPTIASQKTPIKTDVVRMELAGAAPGLKVTGSDILPGKINYFIGKDPSTWRTNLPTYGKVKYAAVYPGVDLVYYGNQRQLEYDFVVAPGADASQVHLHFAGAEKLAIDSIGNLRISASNGEISFHKPVVYQMKDGKREPVSGKFQLLAKSDLGFALGNYDHSRELVIDPTLAYSTYLGGSTSDSANGIAVDAGGHAYVTGSTYSSDFPTDASSYEATDPAPNNGNHIGVAFITKFHHDGSGLIYSTFLGGTGGDSATAIALDSAGNAYVTGTTSSNNFPVTPGAYKVNNAGDSSFVTKLSPTGTNLVYSTYIANSPTATGPIATGIAVDPSGHAYVTGFTFSKSFPVSVNAFQKTNHALYYTAFVVKLSEAGNSALYSTYLGGSDYESAYDIAVGNAGEAYVTGTTYSHDFPETAGAYQTKNKAAANHMNNAFVTKLNATGSGLVYSTYLGGSGAESGDTAYGIAIDASGDAYVTGNAYSDDFPTTNGAYQTVNYTEGADNAFVAKLNAAGSQLLYSTYLGGSGAINVAPLDDDAPGSWGDSGSAIAVDSIGDAYITGYAVSSDFPVTNDAYMTQDPSGGGNADGNNPVAFFSKLNPAGSQLLYSTYMGGSGCGTGIGAGYDGLGDLGNAIAVDPNGDVYLAGTTCSPDFPTSANAFDPTNKASYWGGFSTGFVSKFWPLDITPAPLVNGVPTTLNFPETIVGASKTLDVTLTNTGNGSFEVTDFLIDPGAPAEFSGQTLTCTMIIGPGGSCTLSVTFSPTSAATYNGSISFHVTDSGNEAQTFTYDLTGTGFFVTVR